MVAGDLGHPWSQGTMQDRPNSSHRLCHRTAYVLGWMRICYRRITALRRVHSPTCDKKSSPMKLLLPARSPVRAFGAALFDTGLRVREEYDELILNQRDFELRIHATERSDGCAVRSRAD